jgi:hypothetical protein
MPIAEIIKRSRPDQPKAMDESQINWHALWLLVWVYRAFPDSYVRYKAIEMALEKQFNWKT